MRFNRRGFSVPLALVNLEHQQRRHVSHGGALLVLDDWCVFCVRNAGECRNRDCKENNKARVVVTITIRSHRLAVMPEVCANGWRDTAAAAAVATQGHTYDTCFLPYKRVFSHLAHTTAKPDPHLRYPKSLKNRQFRVYKVGKPVLQSENVHFWIHKRCCKRWL